MSEDDQDGAGSLRFMAIVRAAHDFGLSHEEIFAVAGPFVAGRPRCEQLADALCELILARRPLTA